LLRDSVNAHDPAYIEQVRAWQSFLMEQGFDLGDGGADGDFGPKTEQATKAFQAQHGLEVDGIAGKNTLEKADDIGFNSGLGAPGEEDIDGVRLAKVLGSENVDLEFKRKVIDIGKRLDVNPSFLMAVMAFETGHTFRPDIPNAAGSGAVGLIQFMPATARDLGTTTGALAAMSALNQLDFVEEYFRRAIAARGKLENIEDTYMAVLFPKLVGKPQSAIFAKRPTERYALNRGLDLNGDGIITKFEAAQKVRRILNGASVEVVRLAGTASGDAAGGDPDETLLQKGDRGREVRLLQEKLVALGHMTQSQMDTGVGIFGPHTERAVEEFQHEHGLEINGILTPETRAALKAAFDNLPEVDRVDPDAITTQVPAEGHGYITYGPRHKKFARIGVFRAIEDLARLWIERHPEHLVQVGNISKLGGGRLPPHQTHRQGRDVDFRPFRRDALEMPVTIHDAAYSHDLTEEFVDLVHERQPGCRILFNDPRLVAAGKSIDVSGHHNHLHITFPD
jgi:peptidoglycan hydrolase-like protein with peptidoglycan-binding domain